MESKRINLSRPGKVLSENELKNVRGGCGGCTVCCGDGSPCRSAWCLGIYHCIDVLWEICGPSGWTTGD